ncbi:MAG: undecaprenyldiphospho-muramoylpentapeptide beta-N-acetylglucosaminyltransferase [Patescibacteria group bacterium]
MRILVAGGGTGGHVVPALAVSAELRRRGADVLFVGGTGPADRKRVAAAGFEFRAISAGKLRRYFSLRTAIAPFLSIRGYRQSRRIIKEFRPDVLFAKGGFVALPVARAARRLGVPIVLHESDLVPGLANRLAERWASAVAVSFPPERMSWMPDCPVVLTGNPLRSGVAKGNAARFRKRLGLKARLPIVLVLGGSQGSLRINELVAAALPDLLPECQVIHQVGERWEGRIARYADGTPEKLRGRYHGHASLDDDLFDAYAAADLFVSRAGAGGIAEIAAVGKPSILIPLPTAAGGHQEANAALLAEYKAALVLPEEDLDAKTLARAVLKLLHDPTRRSRMGRAARALARSDAAAAVAKLVMETAETGVRR